MSATLLLLGFEFRISLFFATRESIDCYIALFGKNYPNSLNPSGGDLFRILSRIGVSIGVSVRLTSFAHRAADADPLFCLFFATHTTQRLDTIIIIIVAMPPRQKMPDSASECRTSDARRGCIARIAVSSSRAAPSDALRRPSTSAVAVRLDPRPPSRGGMQGAATCGRDAPDRQDERTPTA